MLQDPPDRNSVRQELLVSAAVLFLGGILLAVSAVALTLPFFDSPLQAALLIGTIVAADLAIIVLFLRSLLERSVFEPLERIGEHAENVAGGAYGHRIPQEEGEELDRLIRGLNTMAEKFISDQEKLAENVRSLDRTNQELVETTEELVRAARMASVGTLAAGVAHEVGNPLGALMGYLDVARRRLRSGAEVDPPLESAVEEARRIDRIVRSILEFARPGGEHEEHNTVAVPAAVDRTLDLLEGRGVLEGVSVTRVVEISGVRVRARAQYIEQILVNLLMNALWAVKEVERPELRVRLSAGPPSGRKVRTRRESDPPGVDYLHRRRIPLLLGRGTARDAMHVEDADREVIIQIEDNGSGVPEDRLPHLFDPFYTTRDPGEGTGLGLTITARIVQELGGTIDADNHERGGARFTVRLPVVPEEEV